MQMSHVDSIASPVSLLTSYLTRFEKQETRSRLTLSSNTLLSPPIPDVIYPIFPPETFNYFTTNRDTIDVDVMVRYHGIIDPNIHVPADLLHEYLKEGIKAEFEEYRDMPLSGNSACLIDNDRGFVCRGGSTAMDTVCKF
jgi:hypothetical protein